MRNLPVERPPSIQTKNKTQLRPKSTRECVLSYIAVVRRYDWKVAKNCSSPVTLLSTVIYGKLLVQSIDYVNPSAVPGWNRLL